MGRHWTERLYLQLCLRRSSASSPKGSKLWGLWLRFLQPVAYRLSMALLPAMWEARPDAGRSLSPSSAPIEP